jgi:hypothetical protein
MKGGSNYVDTDVDSCFAIAWSDSIGFDYNRKIV